MVRVDGLGTLPRYRDCPNDIHPQTVVPGEFNLLYRTEGKKERENQRKVLLDTSLPGINSCSFYPVYWRHKQLNKLEPNEAEVLPPAFLAAVLKARDCHRHISVSSKVKG